VGDSGDDQLVGFGGVAQAFQLVRDHAVWSCRPLPCPGQPA
jgi:hypothetical protein